MAITGEIDLPNKPKESRRWTFQSFNFLGVMKNIARKFNIYQWAFITMLVLTAIKEFTNEHMSVFWYASNIIVLLAALWSDKRIDEQDIKKEKK